MIQRYKYHILALFLTLFFSFNGKSQPFSFTATPDTICQGSCITFVNTSTHPTDSIRWYIKGITISNPHADTISACFPQAGNDTVKLYAFDSVRMDSAVHIVTIKPKPHPRIIGLDSAGIDSTACCSVVDSYLNYQWYEVESPTLISGATNHSFSAGMGKWYVVVDSGGCLGISDTASVPEAVSNVYTLNSNIRIYPNPAQNELTIAASPGPSKGEEVITSLTISNLIGQVVASPSLSKGGNAMIHVDVSYLPSGIYFIKVNGLDVRRFVKE